MRSQPNFENRTLCRGDNLPFLQGMNTGTVDLIATDPPFNKSRDFHATPDKLAAGAKFEDRWCWIKDVQDVWLREIHDHEPEVERAVLAGKEVHSSGMGAFLCWLGVRLLEMRRLLAPTGSIYLHIDHTAHAYAKMLMDAVFGRVNFRNEIVWAYPASPSAAQRDFPRKHDTILRYSRGRDWIFNSVDVRVPYAPASLDRIRYPANASTVMHGRDIQLRPDGKIPPTVWADIQQVYRYRSENTGYPTQKPLKLYERILLASSRPGDVVLDPFCGCATTPVAAERLGRRWVGMDLWDGAYDVVQRRLAAENLAADTPSGRAAAGTEGRLPFDRIRLVDVPFERTDGGGHGPAFDTPSWTLEAPRERHPHPRTQHAALLVELGPICQGCARDYAFDPRVLEVDHRRPKADGGSDAYDNLTLLCPPCNRIKRDHMTLVGLQAANRNSSQWQDGNAHLVKHRKSTELSRRSGRRRRA